MQHKQYAACICQSTRHLDIEYNSNTLTSSDVAHCIPYDCTVPCVGQVQMYIYVVERYIVGHRAHALFLQVYVRK